MKFLLLCKRNVYRRMRESRRLVCKYVRRTLLGVLSFLFVSCHNGNEKESIPISIQDTIEANVDSLVIEKDTVYSLKISAVGDLMVHDYQIMKARRKDTDSFDFSPVFKQVQPYLDEADLLMGNLETVFAGKNKGRNDNVCGYASFPYFNSPNSFGEALASAGFDILTTANNHTLDSYPEGVISTLDLLDSLKIKHVGTARDSVEKERLCIIGKNGIKIGFSGYTYSLNGIRKPKDKPYLVNEFVNYDTLKISEMCEEVRRLRKAGADFVVTYVHCGTEYQKRPNRYQQKVADSLYMAGSDLILMSHPHILQKLDVKTTSDSLRKCLVAYSLGNFVSGQVSKEETYKDIGAILEVIVRKEKDSTFIGGVSVIPTYSYWRKDHIGVLPVIKAHDHPEQMSIQLRRKDTVNINRAYHHTLEVLRGDMDSTKWQIGQERYVLDW